MEKQRELKVNENSNKGKKPPQKEHVEEGEHEPTGRGCPTRRAGRRQLEDVSFPHVSDAKHKDARANHHKKNATIRIEPGLIPVSRTAIV